MNELRRSILFSRLPSSAAAVVEVGPRDGLQNEPRVVRAAAKVNPGYEVAAAQALVTVRAAAAGRVARVPAAEGSRVEAGALLVEVEPAAAAAAPAAEREEAP
jgi:multidrug efflux pump subunit AcrA (membrane-fusion protein)